VTNTKNTPIEALERTFLLRALPATLRRRPSDLTMQFASDGLGMIW